MKSILRFFLMLPLLGGFVGCDAFSSLMTTDQNTAQGTAYELVLACEQDLWRGEPGDTLRSVLCAPVEYLPQREPLFDVLRVAPEGFKQMIACHRNIIKVVVNPEVKQAAAVVEEDVTAEPQTIVTLQAPDARALTDYVSEHRKELVQVFMNAERDRTLAVNRRFRSKLVEEDIRKLFRIDMIVPTGYFTAQKGEDFLWARREYPAASQGFFLYSYPYTGKESLSEQALTEARNRFAARIPGPAAGSYMTTSHIGTVYRMFRSEGRLWCELRGFWDVEGDYMGGPFVSYTTVDVRTQRVVTLDCYVYSPEQHKRNFMRGVENLFYGISFPKE